MSGARHVSRYVTSQGGVVAQFAELMVKLAEAIGTTLTETRIRTYAHLLGDLEWEEVCRAFSTAGQEGGSYFPSPGTLRGYVRPSGRDAALLAWTSLSRAATEAGAYADVTVSDGAAADALQLVFGSWASFCAMEEGPELALKRQEFMAAYMASRRRVRVPRTLRGLCEGGPTWHALIAADGTVRTERQKALAEAHGKAALPEAREVREVQESPGRRPKTEGGQGEQEAP